jgi:hypothetical protein
MPAVLQLIRALLNPVSPSASLTNNRPQSE